MSPLIRRPGTAAYRVYDEDAFLAGLAVSPPAPRAASNRARPFVVGLAAAAVATWLAVTLIAARHPALADRTTVGRRMSPTLASPPTIAPASPDRSRDVPPMLGVVGRRIRVVAAIPWRVGRHRRGRSTGRHGTSAPRQRGHRSSEPVLPHLGASVPGVGSVPPARPAPSEPPAPPPPPLPPAASSTAQFGFERNDR